MKALGCVVIAVIAVACIRSETDECGDGTTCRAGTFCVRADEDFYVCAPNNARDVCTNASLDDGATCQDNTGRCYDGACVPIVCGDRLVDPGEPEVLPAEMCDDGNTVSGDGCAADCRSNEQCGNGVVDPPDEICDDGNPYSNDGCNVRCELETASWTHVGVGSPPVFAQAAMAYDPLRGEAILVGDTIGPPRTYKLNSAWTAVVPPLQPEQRTAAAMTYDVARRQIVLFGGDTPSAVASLGDTWVWDGASWSLVDTAGPNRAHAMIAYDARRERVVLFGGRQKRQLPTPLFKDDTWEWDGATWTQIQTPTRPSVRADAAMAYDPVRGVTVLFGGIASNTRNAETWEYDGTTWTRMTPLASPPALDGAAMVAYHGKMLLFGGSTAATGADRNDTWLYDGTTWVQLLDPSSQIEARRGQAMVYDSSRDRVIAFGGSSTDSATIIDQGTFLFDGQTWVAARFIEELPPGATPRAAFDAARGRALVIAGATTFGVTDDAWTSIDPQTPEGTHPLAFDRARDEAILVGGSGGGSLETWRFANSTWTKIAPTPQPSPDARVGHALAYDRDREEVVLYGGGNSDTDNDTWVWNGTAWTLRDAESLPGLRHEPSMAYDPIRRELIMFGGSDDRTFAWDGTTWREVGESVPTVERPIARQRASMAWNPSRRRIAMFGGTNHHVAGQLLDDLWEWDGTRWTEVVLSGRPEPRKGAALVPDTNGLGLYLFGGEQASSSPGDLWHLVWRSSVQRDRCLDLRDSDGDSLAGCDDPDCWAACHPMCEPGLDCPGAPSCGDGTEDATETCRMCPDDTGGACEICGDAYCGPGEDCAADCQ